MLFFYSYIDKTFRMSDKRSADTPFADMSISALQEIVAAKRAKCESLDNKFKEVSERELLIDTLTELESYINMVHRQISAKLTENTQQYLYASIPELKDAITAYTKKIEELRTKEDMIDAIVGLDATAAQITDDIKKKSSRTFDSQAESQAAEAPKAKIPQVSMEKLPWKEYLATLPPNASTYHEKECRFKTEGRTTVRDIDDVHTFSNKIIILSKRMKNFHAIECHSFQDGYYEECRLRGIEFNPIALKCTHTLICSQENMERMICVLKDNNFIILCVGEKSRIEETRCIGEKISTHMRIIARPRDVIPRGFIPRDYIEKLQKIQREITAISLELHKDEIAANKEKHAEEIRYGLRDDDNIYEVQFKLQYKKSM